MICGPDQVDNHQKPKKQTAINAPRITPSRRFLLLILDIIVFIPGTWLAAPTIRRFMLVRVSR